MTDLGKGARPPGQVVDPRRRKVGHLGASGLVLGLLVGCALAPLGCVSALRADRAAELFVTASAPGSPRMGEEVLVDQAMLDKMRALAEERGQTLVAVGELPLGIHPYLLFAFLRREQDVQVVMTQMYWGATTGKWEATISPRELRTLARAASLSDECSAGPLADSLFGASWVHWPGGSQVVCAHGLFLEEISTFVELLETIWQGASTVPLGR